MTVEEIIAQQVKTTMSDLVTLTEEDGEYVELWVEDLETLLTNTATQAVLAVRKELAKS